MPLHNGDMTDETETEEESEANEFGSAGWDDHDMYEWIMECRGDD